MPSRSFGAPSPYRQYYAPASAVWTGRLDPFELPPGTRNRVETPPSAPPPYFSASRIFPSNILTDEGAEVHRRFFTTPAPPRSYYPQNSFTRGGAGADAIQVTTTQPPFSFVSTPSRRPPLALSGDVIWPKYLTPAEGYEAAGGGAFINTPPPFRINRQVEALEVLRRQIGIIEPDLHLRKFVAGIGQHYRPAHCGEGTRFFTRQIVIPTAMPEELRTFVQGSPPSPPSPSYRADRSAVRSMATGDLGAPRPGPGIYIPVLRRRRR